MPRVCAYLLLAGFLLPHAGVRAEEKGKEAKPIEVPYRLTVPKHVLVRAKINGKGPFNFILDTGAPALFVAVPVCEKLGIKGDRSNWGTFDSFEIEGGVKLKKVRGRVETPFQLEGMNGLGMAGAEIHGLIGYDVLARYRMTIDFNRSKMLWTPLSYKPAPPLGMGGKGGGGAGGLEVMGGVMKMLGGILGRKATPETRLRGFLGMNLVDDGGLAPIVKGVLGSGPAGKAGLLPGDRLTHFQGRLVTDVADVLKFAARVEPGDPVVLTVKRDNGKKEIRFKAGEGI